MYFIRKEFACKCGCGFDTVDFELMAVLIELREHFGVPVIINSGCRCHFYNKQCGGVAQSQHLLGRAADITVKGVHPDKVFQYLNNKYPGKYGIILYNTFTHIDTRTKQVRLKK